MPNPASIKLADRIQRLVKGALDRLELRGDQVRSMLPGNVLPPGGPNGDGYPPVPHADEHESGGSDALDLGSLAGQVTTTQIANNAVTTAKILDANVTIAKLSFDPATQAELDAHAATAGTTAVPAHLRLAADGEVNSAEAVAANDSRLSNDRFPTAHAATHRHGGGDEVGTATPTANAIVKSTIGGWIHDDWLSIDIPRINEPNLDWSAKQTFGAGIGLDGTIITDVADPVSAQDAATKAYIDSLFTSGIWTPAWAGSTGAGVYTYTSQVGNWRRIGNMLYVDAQLIISAISTPPTGNMTITGLPFSSSATTPGPSLTLGFISQLNLSAGAGQLTARMGASSATILLAETFDNAAAVEYPAANFVNTAASIRLSGWIRL